MYERTFQLIVRGLQLVVPPVVTAVVLLVAGLEIAGRPAPPPQVVVVPEAEASEPYCAPEEPPPPRAPDPPPPPPPPARSTTVLVLESSQVTEWLGVVDIRRSAVEGLLASHSSLCCTSTRILPHMTDGDVDGFRLYGIRQSSTLWAMGFRNGDIVHSVNDRDLTSPDAALDVYVARPPYLDIRLTRRGRPARLLVLVHDDPRA